MPSALLRHLALSTGPSQPAASPRVKKQQTEYTSKLTHSFYVFPCRRLRSRTFPIRGMNRLLPLLLTASAQTKRAHRRLIAAPEAPMILRSSLGLRHQVRAWKARRSDGQRETSPWSGRDASVPSLLDSGAFLVLCRKSFARSSHDLSLLFTESNRHSMRISGVIIRKKAVVRKHNTST